jgi:methionyl-tRNA formyltransferase
LFAYGEIITSSQLAGPKQGFWNIHLSLLPAFRGATPTVFPIILGHKTTGTTLTKMDSELDHGPIIAQHEREITPSTTNTQLINLLADDSFELFKTVINSYDLSEVPMQPQNHEHATYTRTLNRHDGFIELNFVKSALKNEPTDLLPAILKNHIQNAHNAGAVLFNIWRGLTPWPGIWTQLEDGKRLKLLECELLDGTFELKTVQIEGKNPAHFSDLRSTIDL